MNKKRCVSGLLAAWMLFAGMASAYASGGEEQAAAADPPQTVVQSDPAANSADPAADPAQDPAADPSAQGTPAPRSGIAEGAYEAPGGDDWNWKDDPTVKVDAAADPSGALSLPCRNAILVSTDTGEVLYEMQPDVRVPIASITKLMTLLLTFEAIDAGKISLTDTVPISEHAYNMGGSQIWLEPGETFTLDELVKAICVSSANDAAVAVAEYVGGSESVFAEMMNAKAKELGMENTHFMNACGLDEENHYSTARDVAVMSRELMKHETVMQYTGIWTDSLRGGETQLVNTNKLLKTYSGATGLKTGTTSGAGVCIAATAEREGMGLLAVVLGSPSSAERFVAATRLLDYGFANYELAQIPTVQGMAQALTVTGGISETVGLTTTAPSAVLVKKGQGAQLSAVAELPAQLAAPIMEGQKIGEIVLSGPQGEVGRYEVTAKGQVDVMNRENAWALLWNSLLTG